MAKIKKRSPVITYAVYDKKTGNIVHMHNSYDAEQDAYSECDPEEVKQLVTEDDFVMLNVTDSDPNNLEVIATNDIPEVLPLRDVGYNVDLKSKKVVEKPKLQLSTKKTQLEGDGKDQSKIDINVMDKRGKVFQGYNGEVKVTTSRGKLSARGGQVQIKKGVGQVGLTSVNETVNRVTVAARCLEGKCISAKLEFEFV